MSAPHVAVVGGGLAGLQAALVCADAGVRVTLLEGRSRLGGATWSKPHRSLGVEIDNGQHVFMRCCDRYLAFLERLGVRDRVVLQERLAVPVARPGRPLVWIRRQALPAPAHLAASLLGYAPLPIRARLRAATTARAFTTLDPEDPALDRLSLGEWLLSRGESTDSIERLWDVLIRSTLNIRAQDASLALAAKVLRTGFLDRPDGADLGWAAVPLAQLHEAPAARALRRAGATILCRTPVDAIEPEGVRGAGVLVRGERLDADAVIVATPHLAAADLLAPFDRDGAARARGLGVSSIVNLHAVFDRPVLAQPFVAGLDSPLQWIFDRTASSGLEAGQYLTVSLSDGDAYLGLSRSELERDFLPAFHALLPETRRARLVHFSVTNERTATFRQCAGARAHRLAPGRRAPGVYVAGAWTDTGWPATMESAVRSGRTAAIAALRDVLGAERAEELEAA